VAAAPVPKVAENRPLNHSGGCRFPPTAHHSEKRVGLSGGNLRSGETAKIHTWRAASSSRPDACKFLNRREALPQTFWDACGIASLLPVVLTSAPSRRRILSAIGAPGCRRFADFDRPSPEAMNSYKNRLAIH